MFFLHPEGGSIGKPVHPVTEIHIVDHPVYPEVGIGSDGIDWRVLPSLETFSIEKVMALKEDK